MLNYVDTSVVDICNYKTDRLHELLTILQMQTNGHLKQSKQYEDAKCSTAQLISVFKGDKEQVKTELPFTLPEKCHCSPMSARKLQSIIGTR